MAENVTASPDLNDEAQTVKLTLSTEGVDKLKRAARAENTSPGDLIERMLDEYWSNRIYF